MYAAKLSTGHAHQARQKEPLDNPTSYFPRPDQCGDNIGNPNTRRDHLSRQQIVNLILKEKAERNPRCQTVDLIKSGWPVRDLRWVRENLHPDCTLEYFGDFNSADLRDYHIIYDTLCGLDNTVHTDSHIKVEFVKGGTQDPDDCIEGYSSTEELNQKLLGILQGEQKALIKMPTLSSEQKTIKFLRNQARKNPGLKFVLVPWAQEYVVKVLDRQEVERRQNSASAGEPKLADRVHHFLGLGLLSAVGWGAFKLIQRCRGQGEPAHAHAQ